MFASIRVRIFAAMLATAAGSALVLAAWLLMLPGTFRVRDLIEASPALTSAAIIALLAIALLLAAALSRWVVGALGELSEAAAAFAAGDHSKTVSPSGPRELRTLGEAFNAMAGEVGRSVETLRAEERRTTQFISDVSHELRTPLTAIRGAAETLLDGDVDEEHAERFLSTIAAESDRLARLADDLVTLQRIEGATGELPLRVIDLEIAAGRVAAALEPLMEDREVTLTISGEAPNVLGDLDRIQQVIANLVDNASRIVGKGGNVWVRLGYEDGMSVLEVLDDGPGIPEQDLERLFDRFYRTETSRDRVSGGMGLGLAITQAIVRAHAGEITAAHRPEGGSVFTVRLPSVEPPPRA